MTSDHILIRQSYQNVKSRCTCPVCLHDGQPVEEGKVEFHHIDPATKQESISKLVYHNIAFPDPYIATKVYVEFGKVIPLCPKHHKELHRAEERCARNTTSIKGVTMSDHIPEDLMLKMMENHREMVKGSADDHYPVIKLFCIASPAK